MIRFSGTKKDRKFIGLGLTRENVDKLTAGQPIVVDGASVGVSGIDVLVLFGETPDDVIRILDKSGAIGSSTTIHHEGTVH